MTEQETEARIAEVKEFAADTVADTLKESTAAISAEQAEAEKWRTLAEQNAQQARENLAAVARVEALERTGSETTQQVEERIAEIEALAKQAKDEAIDASTAEAKDWEAEAEKWKNISRKFEKTSRNNLGAAARLEKLEREREEQQASQAEQDADLERRAELAELRAMRYEVANEMGVPLNMISFLAGNSKKEMEESADALLASIDDDPSVRDELDDAETAEQERQQAEAEKESELQKRVAEAEVKATRLEVAAEKQLPASLTRFLTASSRKELEDQADVLLSVAPRVVDDSDDVGTRRRLRSTRPRERLRSGAVPDVEPEYSTAELAERILKKQRGF